MRSEALVYSLLAGLGGVVHRLTNSILHDYFLVFYAIT